MGVARDIPVYRVSCPPNQGGDGVAGRAFGWVVDTGTYRTHTKNNGASPIRGTFLYAGELWRGCTAHKVSSASGKYPGRTNNAHSESVSGFHPADGVSPFAEDSFLPGGSDFDSLPAVAQAVLVFEYSSACSGMVGGNAGAPTHYTIPTALDTYIFTFWEILWSTSCTGSIKMWRQIVGQTNLAAGPVVNLTNIRTLDPSGVWPGIQFWHGIYSLNHLSGANIVVDEMLSMWGHTWQEMWDDDPSFVEFQTNSSTGNNASCTLLGSINTSTFPIPTQISSQLNDPPGGGSGPTPPSVPHSFGKLSVGTTSGALSVNARRGCVFQTSEPLTLTDIYVLLQGVATSGDTALIRCAAYACTGNPATGGVPSSLLAQSASTSLQGDLVRQWVRFPLTTNPNVAAGDYIEIAIHAGGTQAVAIEWDAAGGFFFFKTPDTYSDGIDTTWGTSTTTDARVIAAVVAGNPIPLPTNRLLGTTGRVFVARTLNPAGRIPGGGGGI